MIQKMEVFSSRPSAPELHMATSELASDDPIHILDVDGIGPVKAEISTTPFATGNGELYQGSSVGKRNIILKMGLHPDWEEQTVASLRQLLYAYFMPQLWIKLRFFSDDLPVVDIEGYVESMDPNIFSQDPEIQVSIICPKPDFIQAEAVVITGTVDDGTIEQEFEYLGSVPTGFELRVEKTIANPSYTGPLEVRVKSPFLPQVFQLDTVTVDTVKEFRMSTVKNRKRVQNVVEADGVTTNLLYHLSDISVWAELQPGLNVVSVIADEPDQLWTLAYFNRFGGL